MSTLRGPAQLADLQGTLCISAQLPYIMASSAALCQGISEVLVRLTTCKRSANSLPKLSLTTLSPPETAGRDRSAGYKGGLVNIQAISFPGYTGESIFQVRHRESLKKFIMVDVGLEPTVEKTHGLSTTPFVKA